MTPLEKLAAIVKARTAAPWSVSNSTDVETSLDDDERYCEWMGEITAKHEDGTEYLSLLIQSCGLHRFAEPNARFIATMGTLADLMVDVIRQAEHYRDDFRPSGLNGALDALNAAIERMESK